MNEKWLASIGVTNTAGDARIDLDEGRRAERPKGGHFHAESKASEVFALILFPLGFFLFRIELETRALSRSWRRGGINLHGKSRSLRNSSDHKLDLTCSPWAAKWIKHENLFGSGAGLGKLEKKHLRIWVKAFDDDDSKATLEISSLFHFHYAKRRLADCWWCIRDSRTKGDRTAIFPSSNQSNQNVTRRVLQNHHHAV